MMVEASGGLSGPLVGPWSNTEKHLRLSSWIAGRTFHRASDLSIGGSGSPNIRRSGRGLRTWLLVSSNRHGGKYALIVRSLSLFVLAAWLCLATAVFADDSP